MGAPRNPRFAVQFDEWFPQGLYLVGEIAPLTEYQSQEDKARNRPVRPRIDEATGKPLFRATGMTAPAGAATPGRNSGRQSSGGGEQQRSGKAAA
jgi:hypothetical protein